MAPSVRGKAGKGAYSAGNGGGVAPRVGGDGRQKKGGNASGALDVAGRY